MKKLLGGIAISALLAAPASTADMRMPVKAPPPVVETVYNWTGFYFGGHAGYGWTGAEWLRLSGVLTGFDGGNPPPGIFDGAPSHDMKGFLGGGQVGYNLQRGQWVFGLEASLSGSAIKGTSLGPVDDVYTTKMGWLFLGTGRVGFAVNRALFYGKGGGAAASLKSTIFDPDPGDVQTSARVTHYGWTAGAGIEFALTDWVSLGAEYNYVDLQSKTHTWNFGGATATVRVDPDPLHVVWGRVNFRFGAGPVVARY